MRLGGPVDETSDPDAWLRALDERGYSAAAAPVGIGADPETVRTYRTAATRADVELAEVGAWGANPISPDPDERAAGIQQCARALELADAIGARCAVNVAGSRGDVWDGPHPDNLSEATFERVVESVRAIIDRADPDDAVYTLEPMPWTFPHDIESHRRLIEAIDREAFGVHFDPVNMLSSPERVYDGHAFVRDFVDALGDHIAVVHLKDVRLADDLTVHIEECQPGAGDLDYRILLSALAGLDADLPLLLEHLDSDAAYAAAREHVRTVADAVGVSV